MLSPDRPEQGRETDASAASVSAGSAHGSGSVRVPGASGGGEGGMAADPRGRAGSPHGAAARTLGPLPVAAGVSRSPIACGQAGRAGGGPGAARARKRAGRAPPGVRHAWLLTGKDRGEGRDDPRGAARLRSPGRGAAVAPEPLPRTIIFFGGE